jgi:predicted MFS family arabinose efflux permease
MKKNSYIFACSFLHSFTTSIMGFSLVYLLTDRFGFSAGMIGASVALGSLCYFLCCNIYQRLGGGLKPQRVIPASVAAAVLAAILLALVRVPWIVVGASVIIQGSSGFFWPPIMAWFTQGLNEAELNRDISRFNRCWMGGSLAGPLIGGVLYRVSSVLSFLVVICGFVFIFFLLMKLAAITNKDESNAVVPAAAVSGGSQRARAAGHGSREEALQLFKICGWLGALCASAFTGMLGNIFPLYIRDGLGYTERTAGMLLLFRGLAAMIGFSLFARLSFWHFNRRWFLIVQGACLICALFFMLAGKNLFLNFAAIAVYGFFYSGMYNNSIFHSSAGAKNNKSNLAIHEIFLSIGNMLGSFGGGLCYQRFGMTGTFLALSLVLSLVLAVYVLLIYRNQPRVQLR